MGEERGVLSRPVGSAYVNNKEPLPRVRPSLVSAPSTPGKVVCGQTLDLEPGTDRTESFSLLAGENTSRRYVIAAGERFSWECYVAGRYTVDFSAKVEVPRGRSEVSLGGRRLNLVGVDSSRVVQERQRRGTFHGYLDLGGEHAECLDLAAAPNGGNAFRAMRA